ncbi:hypothetical protein LSCM1_08150 [Leishmania martiniquensis]|uniref:Uncharacterized protein n=1 Tax=Leishmania martiniquensis TaxID=1580590 RepID=A0A836H789_9TRYP|nr:hypothetical protein LSCM1_08150 [Leishmania martiniquensis]
MPAREPSVSRLVRAVAHGDGDWANVPLPVRDAIVTVLTQPSASPLLRALSSVGEASCDDATGRATRPANAPSARPMLTEVAVQSSIDTFEDAAWVRDEAVRSYAEFHNNVESLHSSMRTQLRPVWRTAMQLHPDLLADVRGECHLSRRDSIPDGIPIPLSAAHQIAMQEDILNEMEDTLQLLRNTSVRFAAHFLSDAEKISMGANPAYLRAPDIDREVVASRSRSTSTSTQRALPARAASASSCAGAAASGQIRPSTPSAPAAAAAAVQTPREHQSPPHHSNHAPRHRDCSGDLAGLVSSKSSRRVGSGKSSGESRGAADDPLLEELRQQYQLRVRELKAQSEGERERWPSEDGASPSAGAAAPVQRASGGCVSAPRSSSASSTASSASASELAGSSSTRSRR